MIGYHANAAPPSVQQLDDAGGDPFRLIFHLRRECDAALMAESVELPHFDPPTSGGSRGSSRLATSEHVNICSSQGVAESWCCGCLTTGD
jgi:hypothetical protein